MGKKAAKWFDAHCISVPSDGLWHSLVDLYAIQYPNEPMPPKYCIPWCFRFDAGDSYMMLNSEIVQNTSRTR